MMFGSVRFELYIMIIMFDSVRFHLLFASVRFRLFSVSSVPVQFTAFMMYQSEGGIPNDVMKLLGRVMVGGVLPAGLFCSFCSPLRRVRASAGPATHP